MNINDSETSSNYIEAINKALQFIEDHLEEELNLDIVSKVAHFSPFHFHRIFKTIAKEPLNAYINRKRIEKAAIILITKKEVSISSLALRYGFNSPSSFTRTFKKFYGLSPSQFRKSSPGKYSKIGQVESKNGQANAPFETYLCDINNHKNWIKMNAKVAIKTIEQLNLAFITHIGQEGLGLAFEQLMKWARPKGLLDQKDFKMATIYHDSFKVTAPDKVRMSACLLLEKPVETNGLVGMTTIEKGKCIVGSFEIGVSEFPKSWTGLFIWMNENGYQKANRDPFEIYHNNFNEHPEKKCIVDFYIPIQ